jgi:hypothetical protein
MYSPLSRQLVPDMIIALPVSQMRDPVERPAGDCAVILARPQCQANGQRL